MSNPYTFTPIGHITSCFKEKFGTPRQPGLLNDATATLSLCPPYNTPEAVRGLEAFSHIWVLFLFHGVKNNKTRLTVRPPRLGGNERIGVFASRSNFRPNPIGLSVVKLDRLITDHGTLALSLKGGDFIDGTPVLDIKPYLPYADSLPHAKSDFAPTAPDPLYRVDFSPQAELAAERFDGSDRPGLKNLITDMLRYNPRPAYQSTDNERIYGTRIYDLEIRWRYQHTSTLVTEILKS